MAKLITMKSWKGIVVILIIPLFAFSSLHKYYVSVTKIDYIKETQAIQITSRIFIDDFEKLLRIPAPRSAQPLFGAGSSYCHKSRTRNHEIFNNFNLN